MNINDAVQVDPLLTTQFSEITDLLTKIAANSDPASPPGRYDLRVQTAGGSGNSNASTIPMRVSRLVLSCDSAAKITLSVGMNNFVFNLVGATTLDLAFPMTIRSGTDCFVATSAGNLGACYFVYEPIR